MSRFESFTDEYYSEYILDPEGLSLSHESLIARAGWKLLGGLGLVRH